MDWTDRLLLTCLLLLNLVLKCSWLGMNELAHDEPFTVYWSQRPWGEFRDMLATENNPPLYFLLIKLWSAFTPFEVAWLRVPSALFSALTVWPLFRLTLRLTDKWTALLAGLLFTLSNYHFGFAHEVRSYSLFTLLTTTSVWLLFSDTRHRPFWLGLVNGLLVYTHFFGWLAIGIQFLVLFSLPDQGQRRRAFLIALIGTVVAYVPYAIVFMHRVGESVARGTWLTTPEPEELYNMIWRWSNAPVLAVLFLALIFAALIKHGSRDPGFRVGLLWAFVPLFGMFLVSLVVPLFLDRYLVYAAPGFALCVAVAIGKLVPTGQVGPLLRLIPALGMFLTFVPWKDNGLHPSRVVEQEERWCAGHCSVEVLPQWYGLTLLAAKDIRSLRYATGQHTATNKQWTTDHGSDRAIEGSVTTAIVINAGADLVDPDRTWYARLKATHPVVDSVEATHKVWVYRFQR